MEGVTDKLIPSELLIEILGVVDPVSEALIEIEGVTLTLAWLKEIDGVLLMLADTLGVIDGLTAALRHP